MKPIRYIDVDRHRFDLVRPIVLLALTCLFTKTGFCQDNPPESATNQPNQDAAKILVQRTIERLALADAFDAKLRQRIWVGGREVVGIGRYEQSGEGSGRLSLEMTIHDGDSRHELRQISDGKLAWFRCQVGNDVTLRRIDIGRVKEVHHQLTQAREALSARVNAFPVKSDEQITVPTWLRIGGLIELIDQIANDFDLRITRGKVDQMPVWILRGQLRDSAKKEIDTMSSGLPALCAQEVRVAIAASGDANGFGVGLPIRIEFWGVPKTPEPDGQPTLEEVSAGKASDSGSLPSPEPSTPNRSETTLTGTPTPTRQAPDRPAGRLISLLEIYSIRKIRPSPEQRFRFEREERDITFSNDTNLYVERAQRSLGQVDPDVNR